MWLVSDPNNDRNAFVHMKMTETHINEQNGGAISM